MFQTSRAPSLDAVIRDLREGSVRARVAAAEQAAASLQREDATTPTRSTLVDALVAALKDGAADVRAAATLALADLKASEALAPLIIAAEDDSPLVRQLAIAALGEIGDSRATERVRRALDDPRAEIRFQAIVAYPRLVRGDDRGREVAWEALKTALEDGDDEVRAHAAEACGELADGDALPVVIADRLATIALETSASDEARACAAIALGESRDDRGASILLDIARGKRLGFDDVRVQTALELAGELGLRAVMPIARAAAFGLRSRWTDPGRRAAALVALVRLDDADARAAVMKDLASGSYARTMLAVGIVARSRLVDARAALVALRDAGTNVDRDAIDDALARLAESAKGA